MAPPTDSLAVDLAEHEWTHRLVLVFAPTEDHPALAEQMAMWSAERNGFEERKLRIYRLVGTGSGRFYRQPDAEGQPISETSARGLRERFGVPTDAFVVILVGLDGTEKKRHPEPLATDDLFATIDAMPMRRAEMRKENRGHQ
ncbi:DUF4174 domain-containing protein [Longibacter salinarum]|nr:DUF4174 domain-containing protein [Longibacter salinarum]